MSNPNDAIRLKHFGSALQKINVLDTTPANVDGKLWFEVVAGTPVVKIFYNGQTYELDPPQPDPRVVNLTGNTLTAGRNKFRLLGFKDALTIHDNTLYANDDTSYATPLGTVTPVADGAKVVGYTFALTSQSAIDFDALDSAGATATFGLSVGYSDVPIGLNGSAVNALSSVQNIPQRFEWQAEWDVYGFIAGGSTHYIDTSGGVSSSYTYHKATGEEAFWFDSVGLIDHEQLLNGDKISNDYITAEEIRDENGNLTSATLVINSASALDAEGYTGGALVCGSTPKTARPTPFAPQLNWATRLNICSAKTSPRRSPELLTMIIFTPRRLPLRGSTTRPTAGICRV